MEPTKIQTRSAQVGSSNVQNATGNSVWSKTLHIFPNIAFLVFQIPIRKSTARRAKQIAMELFLSLRI